MLVRFRQPPAALALRFAFFVACLWIASCGTEDVPKTPKKTLSESEPAPPATPAPVWTQHNDNGRTGAILTETRLSTSTVTTDRFGVLFTAVFNPISAAPCVQRDQHIWRG